VSVIMQNFRAVSQTVAEILYGIMTKPVDKLELGSVSLYICTSVRPQKGFPISI